MSATANISIPSSMTSPAELAAWMDSKLKLLTADLPPQDQQRIRDESIDTITRIAMDFADSGTKATAEMQFKAYYRQVQMAVETSNRFGEARDLAQTDTNNPTVVGQMAKIVSDMNYTKASLLSGLLGGLGMERLAGSLDKLRTLEMVVSGLSGGSGIFSRIGNMLSVLDGRLAEMSIDTSPQGIAQQASSAAQYLQVDGAIDALKSALPSGLTSVLGKFLTPAGAEDTPEMPNALRKPHSNTP